MSTATLSALRALVRQKSDSENQLDRHPDTELDGYINKAHKRLWGRLARLQLLKDVSTQLISADGSDTYNLGDDFLHAYGVFEETSNSTHRPLHRHNGSMKPFGRPSPSGIAATYDIASQENTPRIQFYPQPSSGTYVVQYIKSPDLLTNDSDTVVYPLDWEEALVYDAAIQVLEKDDLPRSELQARLQEINAEIDNTASSRDLLNSYNIRDVRGYSGRDPADQFSYELPWLRGRKFGLY